MQSPNFKLPVSADHQTVAIVVKIRCDHLGHLNRRAELQQPGESAVPPAEPERQSRSEQAIRHRVPLQRTDHPPRLFLRPEHLPAEPNQAA